MFPTLPLWLVLVFLAYRLGVFSIVVLVDAGVLFLLFRAPCCSQEVVVVADPAVDIAPEWTEQDATKKSPHADLSIPRRIF